MFDLYTAEAKEGLGKVHRLLMVPFEMDEADSAKLTGNILPRNCSIITEPPAYFVEWI